MDRYQRVEKPRSENSPINENEIRITTQGRMRNYITYATTLLQVYFFCSLGCTCFWVADLELWVIINYVSEGGIMSSGYLLILLLILEMMLDFRSVMYIFRDSI